MKSLYEVFIKYDATMVEINPLAEDASGKSMYTLFTLFIFSFQITQFNFTNI